MLYTVEKDQDGVRLRTLLSRRLHCSAELLKELKRSETGVLVDGKPRFMRDPVRAGERVFVDCDRETKNADLLPDDLGIRILYEDGALLLFEKPAGIPTHPSRGHPRGTLANGAAFLFAARGEPFVFRPITRLDTDVSGAVLCAKTKYAASLLSSRIAAGQIEKTYLAVTDGAPENDAGRIEGTIRRAEGEGGIRRVFSSSADGGRYARTDYKVLARDGRGALLCVFPRTGRTHQIRVSLAAIGCPIAGDGFYGNGNTASRCMLHAYGIRFSHPLTGEEIAAVCPPEKRLAKEIQERFGIVL
ncbi:MAG: RluA family pseudouridine synthase [Clostridia bacterium]|nr:RluA family pseudouridine synthase [Clostridia bacterium]